MKIGILTYHSTLNVGAALQAYALQKVIAGLGVSCEIIDYRCMHLEEVYRVKSMTEVESMKEFIKWILTVGNTKRAKRKFDQFNAFYQTLSHGVYTRDCLTNLNSDYEVFIVGSDQVWNMDLNGNDATYLLDFAAKDKKRISYAASFGYKEMPEAYKQEIARNLMLFDVISVRETSGSRIVEGLLGKEAQVVLDPTLLLNMTEWEKLNFKRLYPKRYVLLYMVAATPSALKFAKQWGRVHQCDVICIHYSYAKFRGVINVHDCSPLEFLSYIKYAQCVVASSFHGVCFSAVFEKEFFYELDPNPINNNSRIETLMSTLGLENREIVNGSCADENGVDYTRVRSMLEAEKHKSVEFLVRAIDQSH